MPAGTQDIGVLALQGEVGAHLRALAELGVTARPVRTPHDLETVDALVMPGGESTTMSLLLVSSGLAEPLRRRLDDGMPAFGTCAGMILLASEVSDGGAGQSGDGAGHPAQLRLGAIDIRVRRNGFGRQVDSFETDLDVGGIEGGPLHAVFIRAPLVERVGPDVDVLATVVGPDGAARPVVCRQGPVLTASFHPELSLDHRLHELFLRKV